MTIAILMHSPNRATVTDEPSIVARVLLGRRPITYEVRRVAFVGSAPELRVEWVTTDNRPVDERTLASLETERNRYISGLAHACAIGRLP